MTAMNTFAKQRGPKNNKNHSPACLHVCWQRLKNTKKHQKTPWAAKTNLKRTCSVWMKKHCICQHATHTHTHTHTQTHERAVSSKHTQHIIQFIRLDEDRFLHAHTRTAHTDGSRIQWKKQACGRFRHVCWLLGFQSHQA